MHGWVYGDLDLRDKVFEGEGSERIRPRQNLKAKKRSLYADCKRLFFINKKRLMERLKNPDINEDIPSENDVHNVFKTLFESDSLVDNAPIRLLKRDEEGDARRSSVVVLLPGRRDS